MQYLHLTLPTPEENLACDHALMDLCEEGYDAEILRFWESPVPFVVLGHGNKAESEVDLPRCSARGIHVLRRISGGGTVLQGPGCLNYSLILRNPFGDAISGIGQTHALVLGRHKEAMESLLGKTVGQHENDLTLDSRKFSGNAQRRKQRTVLYHGTFLHHFDLGAVSEFLRTPSSQPTYRASRRHEEFLVNLGIEAASIEEGLKTAWKCTEKFTQLPFDRIEELVNEQYSRREWNFKY